MKNILFFFSILTTSLVSGQLPPPPPSMPTADNAILIDELIKVTEFESYFNSYCKNKIEQKAKENNWDEKKKQEIIKSIRFENFAKNTIYNNFARTSEKDLKSIIQIFTILNKKENLASTKFIITNSLIQENLEGYVKTLLNGDYLFLNKK